MAEYTNSVPLGQSGTGGAFVLGRSQAADRLLQTIDYNNQVERTNQVNAQKELEQRQAELAKSLINFRSGNFWDNDIKKLAQDYTTKASELWKNNITPQRYNPNIPEQVKSVQDLKFMKADAEHKMDIRDSAEKSLMASMQEIQKNPNNYYKEDVDKVLNAPNQSFEDIIKNGVPQLVPKLNPLVAIKDVNASQREDGWTVNGKKYDTVKGLRGATEDTIISTLEYNKDAQKYVNNEVTGTTIPIENLKRLPKTKEGIVSQIMEEHDGNPPFRELLAAKGIIKGTPEFDQLINSKAEEAFQAKQKWDGFVTGLTNIKLADVKEKNVVSNDFSAEDQAMQRRTEQRAINKEGDDPDTFRQDIVDRMIKGVAGSGEELKAVVRGAGGYTGDLKIATIGDKIYFNIPERSKVTTDEYGMAKTTTYPKRQVMVDKNDPNAKLTLNQMMNDITGEKVNMSKFMTKGGKGKVNMPDREQQKKSAPEKKKIQGF